MKNEDLRSLVLYFIYLIVMMVLTFVVNVIVDVLGMTILHYVLFVIFLHIAINVIKDFWYE